MASKATITLILLGKLQLSLAAPAHDGSTNLSSTILTASPESQQSAILRASKSELQPIKLYSILFSPPDPLSIPKASVVSPYHDSNTTNLSTSSRDESPKTVTITEKISTTVTVSEAPVTITEVLLPPQSPKAPAPSRTSTAGLGPAKSIWVAPTDLTDLSTFRVTKFSEGQDNLEIVNSVPVEAGTAASDDATPMLQLLFPAGSINPGQKPTGGAEFYASPIDISSARNVTLQYSVLFPFDFDWVLAGKLPGLYGGRTGCSGGDPAVDCFSTRLMWREGGAGELYLYAPKDKQSKGLCEAPGSFCDEAYGFSIGRGSFYWTAGDWTTIRQTVFLNTPGRQDGTFALDVNGKRVISRKDMLYRAGGGKKKDAITTTKHTKTHTTTATKARTSSDDGGLLGLGPLLGSLLGALRRDAEPISLEDLAIRVASSSDSTTVAFPEPTASAHLPVQTGVPTMSYNDTSEPIEFGIASTKKKDVNFVGLFFSTFFGGHEQKYATPKDQYIWFKDFALTYNA